MLLLLHFHVVWISELSNEDKKKTLVKPLIKKGNSLVEATWDDAYSLISEKLAATRKNHGADSIGGLASAKVSKTRNSTPQGDSPFNVKGFSLSKVPISCTINSPPTSASDEVYSKLSNPGGYFRLPSIETPCAPNALIL
jgi:hypothetical protein